MEKTRVKIFDLFRIFKNITDFIPIDKLMDLFQAVDWKDFSDLLEFPSLDDEKACREWAARLLSVADKLTELSVTEVDDDIVALLASAVRDDDVWGIVYKLITSGTDDTPVIYGDPMTDGKYGATPTEAMVVDLGRKVGLDPATIVTIITMIVQVIKWWRNRK